MILVAPTVEAFEAVAETLALGFILYETEANAGGSGSSSRARQRIGGVFLSPREQPGKATEQQLDTSVFRRELPVGCAVAFQRMVVSNCDSPTQFR